jgi:hypothetical protein
MKNKHAIVIRLDYPDCEAFEWRSAFFRSVVLPRLLRQTDQKFDIVIRCNPIHKERIEVLSDKISTFHHDSPTKYGTGLGHIKTGSNSIPAFDFKLDYPIQTRIDSDDLVSFDFVEKIHKEFEGKKEDTLLHFQPMKFDLYGLKTYHVGIKSSVEHMSPFISLYQPNEIKYFIYQFGHTKIGKHFKNVVFIDEGYCWLTVHHNNASTTIRGVDTESF